MKNTAIVLNAFALTAVVAILTNCGSGSRSDLTLPTASVQAVSALSATGLARPANATGTLYVAKWPEDVLVYPGAGNDQKPVRKIETGQDIHNTCPRLMTVDKSGSLYVPQSCYPEQMEVYPRGASKPSFVYTDRLYAAQGVAVTGKGTVYVTDGCCASSGTAGIVVYPPKSTVHSDFIVTTGDPTGITLDAKGNIYVVVGTEVQQFAPGSHQGKSLNLSGLVGPYGILIGKNGDLIVADTDGNVVDVFAPGASSPKAHFSMQQPYGIAFADTTQDSLWVTDINGSAHLLDLSTGQIVNHLMGLGPAHYVTGVAVDPIATPIP